MSLPKFSRQDRDHAAYIGGNPQDGGIDRRVRDLDVADKLDQIIAGTGNDTTPSVSNLAIATANTEVAFALPANARKFIFKSRSKGTIKLAYAVGESGTNYITIPAGAVFTDDQFYVSQTIYFQSSKSGDTLELVAYV